MKKRINKKAGFSMTELMVSCALLAFALTAALQVYMNISLMVTMAKSKTTAVTHAKSIMEELRSRGSAAINDTVSGEDWTTWLQLSSGLGTNNGYYLLPEEQVNVNVSDLLANQTGSPKKLRVTISWNERGGVLNYVLTGAI